MKYLKVVFFLFLSLIVYGKDANSILSKMEQALLPDNYVCKFKTKTTGDKTDVMAGNIYYKKGIGSFCTISSPPKLKGMKFLLLRDRIWLYVPGSSRPVPLSARGNFMGTALSNSDMMESSYTKDYDASFLKDEKVDGRLCYVLDLIPKTRTASYGRIKIWIRKDYTIPVKMEMYAHSGRIYKICTFGKIMKAAGRIRPTHYVLIDYVDNNKKTDFWLLALQEKNDISNTIFTKENLMK